MNYYSQEDIKSFYIDSSFNLSSQKIIALWAFSESTFGGILHALKIPFRGAFINAAAVLFISLIALFSERSKEIIKATIIVILIKATVSPHSPLTAYLAVFIQGLLGYIFFFSKKYFKTSALLLGVFTLLYSGIQKIIVLTVLFGNTLWESINLFISEINKEFLQLGINPGVNFSLILVSIYVGLHLLFGIFIGIYAGNLPAKIKKYSASLPSIYLQEDNSLPKKEKKRKKRIWVLRPSGIAVISISIIVLLITFLVPEYSDIRVEILIMILRSLILTLFWYIFISSFVRKIFQKFVDKNKFKHAKTVNDVIALFPHFREILSYCWKESKSLKGFKRIHYFLSRSFFYLLLG